MSEMWFTEQHAPSGSSVGFRVRAKLHEETTPFQTIAIYDSTDWGRLMVIDGCMMVTSRDNFLYHEMMVHPALYTHVAPRRVVVIGGGDCGTLREVLRHAEVARAVQVEIDERVTRLAEIHFPELCEANADARAELRFDDGVRYIAEMVPGSADVIIVDSTDPVGPAEGLFNEAFYRSCHRALGEGGLLVQQSESPIAHLELIRAMRTAMRKAGFRAMATLPFPQPCYPTGWWSCTMARKGPNPLDVFRAADADARTFPTRYYNSGVHRAALCPPEFLRVALSES